MPDPTRADAAPAIPTPSPLGPDALRWRCPADWLTFKDTSEVEPLRGIRGQDTALEALRFGLATRAPGHHVFVRGFTGTGRARLVGEVLDEIRPSCRLVADHCYVHRFNDPSRPRLITLPRSRGHDFAARVEDLAQFIVGSLPKVLSAESMRSRRTAITADGEERFDALLAPFEKKVADAGATLVTVGDGPGATPAVFPLVDGEPAPPEALRRLRAEGTLAEEDYETLTATIESLGRELETVLPDLQAIREAAGRELTELTRAEIHRQLRTRADAITAEFDTVPVRKFLAELVEAVAKSGVPNMPDREDGEPEIPAVFQVNVLRHHERDADCPVVVEAAPGRAAIFGTIETPRGDADTAPHMLVRAGSLLEADGGFLVLEARDLIAAGRAWPLLARTLRSRQLEIEAADEQATPVSGIKPDPIALNTKIVLVGDDIVFAVLEQNDGDFSQLFKVVADFESTMLRRPESAAIYAGVLARVAEEESLSPFDAGAVRRLVEHGARVAANAERITARLGRICDIAREAAYVAERSGDQPVNAEHVEDAIQRGRNRADLPARRFHDLLADGTIRVDVSGHVVGQINGLATVSAGPITYGFPQRITSSVGPGTLGLVNVEYESELSGSIHTKGFHILRGLMHHLLALEHPLTLDASIVFEQSYGGVDGDSASGAESVCMISALTGTPIRQDLAMTGAIDQRGGIMAIGAVNEKIDGFFDACDRRGLTGTQGVIIPATNVGDLSVAERVVSACADGRFHIHPVQRVEEALALFTGEAVPLTAAHGSGHLPEPGSLLGRARAQAERLWAASGPASASPTPAASASMA
ncbi:MAG: AAA family ATPase [Phycisphaerales bacterium]